MSFIPKLGGTCISCLPARMEDLEKDNYAGWQMVADYLATLDSPEEFKMLLHEHPDLGPLIEEAKAKA